MRWTVWQKRTSCQNCGAKIPVPEAGLTMTCQYCGTESPVPDIEERKSRLEEQGEEQEALRERHEQQGRQARQAQLRRERAADEREAASRRERAQARGGALRGLLGFLFIVGGIGAVLHFTGGLSHLTEPLIGDDGRARYDEAEALLKRDGYVRVTQEKTERAFSATTLFLDLKPGHRYALVLGSGQPLHSVTLKNPRGRRVLRKSTLRYQETLLFTPGVVGVYTAAVQLERPGRYRWALLRGPTASGGDSGGDLLSQRRRRRQRLAKRRSKRRHRTTRRSRTTASRARKATTKAIKGVDPAPPPPAPPPPVPTADDDIKRAIKAGEIEDVDSL